MALYDFGYTQIGSYDGLHIPSTRLIGLVQMKGEISIYLRNGMPGKDSIKNAQLQTGYHIEEFVPPEKIA